MEKNRQDDVLQRFTVDELRRKVRHCKKMIQRWQSDLEHYTILLDFQKNRMK